MVQQICPACGQHKIDTIDRIHTSDLIDLYREGFGIDATSCFTGVKAVNLLHCTSCDLRFFDPPCSGPAEFYEQLQKFDWYYQDDKPEYPYASQHIKAGQRVLDVGCGKGAFRTYLPDGVDYTGLEFNDAAIAKGHAAGLNIIKQSVQSHAMEEPHSYDVVCSFQVLEHVTDVAGFVSGCTGLLKRGGTLILAVPSEDSFLALARNGALNMPPHHVIRWSDRALRQLVRREGLLDAEIWHEPVADFHQSWHQEVLARDWFVSVGLLPNTLIDRGIMSRVVNRLLRNQALRALLATRRAKAFEHTQRGHSVVLVARASQMMAWPRDRVRQVA
jgi:SAM-dependent methyltransferase